MGKFDELLETAGNFINDNKGLVTGGLGGALLGAGAGYGLTGEDDDASPSQKLKKRLRSTIYGGLLGGIAGTGAGAFFDAGNENSLASSISNAITGGSDTEIIAPMWHNYLTAGAGLGTAAAANGAYNKWLKTPIQNSINKDLIDKLKLEKYEAGQHMNQPGISDVNKDFWKSKSDQIASTLERLETEGMLGSEVTKGRTRSGKIGKAGAAGTGLLTTWLLDNFVL